MYRKHLVLLVVTGVLGACSTQAPSPVVTHQPPPVLATKPAVPVEVGPPVVSGTVVPPAVRPVPVQPPRQLADGSRMPAVQGLLATAERERRAGRLDAASAALERAQRLAPQSALIYQRLAEIRLMQKRFPETEQFARKGISFASGSAMQAVFWRLIAEARRQQGFLSSAQEAADRAAALEAAASEKL